MRDLDEMKHQPDSAHTGPTWCGVSNKSRRRKLGRFRSAARSDCA